MGQAVYRTTNKLCTYTRWCMRALETLKSKAMLCSSLVWYISLVMVVWLRLIMIWLSSTMRKQCQKSQQFKPLSTWWAYTVSGKDSMQMRSWLPSSLAKRTRCCHVVSCSLSPSSYTSVSFFALWKCFVLSRWRMISEQNEEILYSCIVTHEYDNHIMKNPLIFHVRD